MNGSTDPENSVPNAGFRTIIRISAIILLILLIVQFIHHYFVVYLNAFALIGKEGSDCCFISIAIVQVVLTGGVAGGTYAMMRRGLEPEEPPKKTPPGGETEIN